VRVLVADDDDELRALVVTALGREGHETSVVGTAKLALEAGRRERFDVVVLDVMFPDGTGLDVCKRLREDGITTPILFLSARGAVTARVDGLEAGADDYLAKPFALRELLLRVRALGRRGPARAESTIEHGGLRLDLGARRAFRDDREIPLTTREWDVLAALASHGGRVLSFEDLLERAWGDTSEGARNSLEVIIGRIRKKVDEKGHESLIRTVRGHGYALAVST
jgi:two-component system response regulator MprA